MKNVNVIPLWTTLLIEDKANPDIQSYVNGMTALMIGNKQIIYSLFHMSLLIK